MRVEAFRTPGPLVLDLRLSRGEIEVETVDTEETTVEISALRDDAERVRPYIEAVEIDLRETGGGQELRVDAEPENGGGFGVDFARGGVTIAIGGRRTRLRIRIRAPHGSTLRAGTATADLRARGRYGELELRTASGDAEVDEVDGDVSLSTASGDVRVQRVGGSLKLQTASGDVNVGGVGGRAELRTASGDVNVDEVVHGFSYHSASGDLQVGSVTDGRVDIKSMSGDVLVGVRRGSRVWLDVRTISGDARSELEQTEDSEGEGPLVELSATAMSGDIRIVRA